MTKSLTFKQWSEKYLNSSNEAKNIYNKVRVFVLDFCIEISNDADRLAEFEKNGLTDNDKMLLYDMIKNNPEA